jgi:predicted nuclease of predicted toxin-antitoxin system
MNFFLDENFPKSAISLLEYKGHRTFDIRGTSNEGMSDISILALAQEKQAIFLTTDKDFFHTIPFCFSSHYGVIVFNLQQPNRNSLIGKLNWILEHYNLSEISSQILLIRDHHITRR